MPRATDKGLVVGVGKYSVASAQSELLSVPNDVRAVARTLKSKRNGFGADVVDVLLNRNGQSINRGVALGLF